MSTKLTPYAPPQPVRSSLLKNPPEIPSVPSIEEIEQLQAELKLLKQSAVARSKKASDDLRTLHESMRRLKEKEKGKARALDKVKRERDCTLLPPPGSTTSHLRYSLHQSLNRHTATF